jgi:gliding motility-associated-like protein
LKKAHPFSKSSNHPKIDKIMHAFVKHRFHLMTLLLCLAVLCAQPSKAQHGNTWAVGYKKGINFNTQPISIISTALVKDTTTNSMTGTSVSYCDCDGNLQLYGSGNQFWNKYHRPMKNGLLNGNSYGPLGMSLVPMPGNPRYMYFFSNYYSRRNYSNIDLKYALIDLNGDAGAGEVLFKDSFIGTGIKANLNTCKHVNGKDVWILQGYIPNTLKAYLLTDTGINRTPVLSKNIYMFSSMELNSNSAYDNYYFYKFVPDFNALKVTRDGKNIICSYIDSSTTQLGCVIMYDFDNATGKASNPQVLLKFSDIPPKLDFYQGNYLYTEISPNDSLIYAVETPWNSSPNSNIVQINRYSKVKKMIFTARNRYIWGFQMGPDGKIYFNTLSNISPTLTELYAITRPNLKGRDCAVKKILTDSTNDLHYRIAPQVFDGYRQLSMVSNLTLNACQDTAQFCIQIDTNFQNLIVYFGDGDSVHFDAPLQSVYNLKHHYSDTRFYTLRLKAQNPGCNTYSVAEDSFFNAQVPKLLSHSKTLLPDCHKATLQVKDSFLNTTHTKYAWNNFENDTLSANNSLIDVTKTIDRDSGWNQIKWTATLRNSYCKNHMEFKDSMDVSFLKLPIQNHSFNGKTVDSVEGCSPFQLKAVNESVNTTASTVVWGQGNNSSVLANDSVLFTYKHAGNFKLEVCDTSVDGCLAFDTVLVKVNPSPELNLNGNATIQCFNTNHFELNANSRIPSTYQWFLPLSSKATFINDSAIELRFPKAGYYQTEVFAKTDLGCDDTASLSFRLMPEIKAVFSGDSTAKCLNGNSFLVQHNLDIDSAHLPVDYQFSKNALFNPSNGIVHYKLPGTFQFKYILTDSLGCQDSLVLQHVVYPMPKLEITANNVCVGVPVYLNYQSDVPLQSSVLFSGDGVSDSKPYYHRYKEAGNYSIKLIGTSLQHCVDSIVKIIQIFNRPVSSLKVDSACLGKPLNILPLCLDMHWSELESMTLSSGNESKTLNQDGSWDLIPEVPGLFKIQNIVMSKKGCSDTSASVAKVYALPEAQFTWSRLGSNFEGIDVQFNNKSTGAVELWWDFGDGSYHSQLLHPLHNYSDSGLYKVILKAMNEFACEDTQSQFIRVLPYMPVYIPDAFTPNQDGLNDGFKPSGTELLKSWKLSIYNRWGEMIFESDNKGWDGKNSQGEDCAEGVYVFYLSTVDLENKKANYRGMVTLRR